MDKIECKLCGKVIEGFNKNQCEFLLAQHSLTHTYSGKIKKTKKVKKTKTIKKSKRKTRKPKEQKEEKKDYVWKEMLRDSS